MMSMAGGLTLYDEHGRSGVGVEPIVSHTHVLSCVETDGARDGQRVVHRVAERPLGDLKTIQERLCSPRPKDHTKAQLVCKPPLQP